MDDDYSWSSTPLHDALLIEMFAAALEQIPEVER